MSDKARAAPVAQEPVAWRSPIHTVADLVNNLLTLDQNMEVHGAYFIDHEGGRKEARARGLSLSREHVEDGRIKRDASVPWSLVIWTAMEATPPATPAGLGADEVADAITRAKDLIAYAMKARRLGVRQATGNDVLHRLAHALALLSRGSGESDQK